MGCVGVNVLLICMVGDYINFYATAGMGSFHSSILPIVTSFTGSLFWYKVMQYLSEKLGGGTHCRLYCREHFYNYGMPSYVC